VCPQFNHAWNAKELSYHQGKSDVWVAVAGKVYDISKFYKAQHSDIVGLDVTSDDMLQLAGHDLTPYFPVPLTLGCGDFVSNNKVFLQNANMTLDVPTAFHWSGQQQSVTTSDLHRPDWYTAQFL
jgi:chitin synthase